MKPLLSILRAAHCRSTHHFFAIDALSLVQTDPGKRFSNLLLRFHDDYLRGSKDPDTRFRDFQNHVIHVNDGYWGGAPRVAHQWYERLIAHLLHQRWADAAHATGVLSHYFTDPLQPLHTAQCEKEKVLHRPLEWSITKSYASIYQAWIDDDLQIVFQLSEGPEWLGEAILHGARYANQKYDSLIEHYDLEAGIKKPENGFNDAAKETLAELFGLTITGWARVLERIALEAEDFCDAPIPHFSLTLPLLVSTIKSPIRMWIRRIESNIEQEAVEDLFFEYERTGELKVHLPAEVDIVQRVTKVHCDERRWQAEREERLRSRQTHIEVVADTEAPVILPFIPQGDLSFRLSRENDLVDAPSIGPKTANRFAEIGIHTVGDFLEASADSLANQLAIYWISNETVSLWQTQARLQCEVPGLRCRDAQMLAGAGCRQGMDLAKRDVETLYQDVSNYANGSAGRRYLRGTSPPSLSEVAKWIDLWNKASTARQRSVA